MSWMTRQIGTSVLIYLWISYAVQGIACPTFYSMLLYFVSAASKHWYKGTGDLQTQDVLDLLGLDCLSRACLSGLRRISFKAGIKPFAKASIRNSAIRHFSVINHTQR